MTKFASCKALKLTALDKLTFDEGVVLHRVELERSILEGISRAGCNHDR